MKPWRGWTNCWREWDMHGRRDGYKPRHPDDNREFDNEFMKLPTNREELMVNNDHLPQGWRWVRLGDVCERPEYGASASARPFDPDLPRYVRITDITDDGRLKADGACSADPEQVHGYELGEGDLLFARSGSVGRTYLHRPQNGPCVFAGYLIRFRPDPTGALPRYVECYTHSDTYRRWVASMLRVGAQPNINAAEYSSLPILLPPIAEQRRIVSVVDSLDEAIDRIDGVVLATEVFLEAMLDELLTRGVPGWHTQWRCAPGFGDVPMDWKVMHLEDVAEVVGGSTPSRADLDYWGGATPWVIPSELTELPGRYLTASREAVTDKGLKAAGLKVIPAGSVLMTSRATIGSTAINTVPVTTNQGFQNLVPKPGCHSLWLYYCISSMQNELRRRAAGSTFLEISGDSVRNLPVLLPQLDEQQAIADALDSVDTRMEEARAERGALELLKASTTEALLTGSVRV